jgi:hypothetical protein
VHYILTDKLGEVHAQHPSHHTRLRRTLSCGHGVDSRLIGSVFVTPSPLDVVGRRNLEDRSFARKRNTNGRRGRCATTPASHYKLKSSKSSKQKWGQEGEMYL